MPSSSASRVAAAAAGYSLVAGAWCWLLPWARRRLRARFGTASVRVESIVVYPIKSCRGHHVQTADLTARGLKDDRCYMVVDGDGKFLSQRTLPKMALVVPSMPDENGIWLRAIGSAPPKPLFVPRVAGTVREVTVWDDGMPGHDQGDGAAGWFAEFLGRDGVRLVRFDDGHTRATDAKYGTGGEATFADGFPVLVTTAASVDAVNRLLVDASPVGADNFRPNVHIGGCHAWEEDEIAALCFRTSGARLCFVKPCARCVMPNVDPASGTRRPCKEPTRALRRWRSAVMLLREGASLHRAFLSKPGRKDDFFFGQNALVDLARCGGGPVRLAVGETADVVWG